MPFGIMTIGHTEAIVVLNCAGFLASGSIAFMNRKYILWREVAKIGVVMIVCMALGAWLITVAPLAFLTKVYGVAIVAIAVWGLFFNKQNRVLPEWVLFLIVVVAGLIQGMFVSGGSFLAIYALQKIKDKNAFRGTTCTVWTILNATYATYCIATGAFTSEVAVIFAVCVPLLIVGTLLGSAAVKRLNQEQFTKFSYALLIVIGVVLFFR